MLDNTLVFRPLALAFALLLTACQKDPVTPTQPALSDHLTLGNPSGATADPSQPTNYLLSKPQYALAYHRERGIPTWVSWHLDATWRGSAPRQDDFRADPALPRGWYQVTPASYTGSGFDRGHHCPSADRTVTLDDNSATFLMTNIMPQAPRNNQQTWADLEDYCRVLVDRGNELYVVCGSYGKGGTGTDGFETTIDQGRVTVPAHCWKVVIALATGTDDANRINAATRVIAIDTPNDNALSADWGRYRTSVDAIESETGLDILSAVPPAVQQLIEARVDNGPTK